METVVVFLSSIWKYCELANHCRPRSHATFQFASLLVELCFSSSLQPHCKPNLTAVRFPPAKTDEATHRRTTKVSSRPLESRFQVSFQTKISHVSWNFSTSALAECLLRLDVSCSAFDKYFSAFPCSSSCKTGLSIVSRKTPEIRPATTFPIFLAFSICKYEMSSGFFDPWNLTTSPFYEIAKREDCLILAYARKRPFSWGVVDGFPLQIPTRLQESIIHTSNYY